MHEWRRRRRMDGGGWVEQWLGMYSHTWKGMISLVEARGPSEGLPHHVQTPLPAPAPPPSFFVPFWPRASAPSSWLPRSLPSGRCWPEGREQRPISPGTEQLRGTWAPGVSLKWRGFYGRLRPQGGERAGARAWRTRIFPGATTVGEGDGQAWPWAALVAGLQRLLTLP